MKILVSVCLALVAVRVVTSDKRPVFRGRPGLTFQRQTDAGGSAEPTTPQPGGPYPPSGQPESGPYPPSGQPESGPYPPSNWKPKGQRLELPARQQQPTDSYGAPAPAPTPATPAEAEPTAETEELTANYRLRQQLRLQRLQLQKLRQQLQEQQLQLQEQVPSQGEYFVHFPDGRLQKVQYATTPGSSSALRQNVGAPSGSTSTSSPSFVAHLQFMDVPHVDAPIYSYSTPLLQHIK